MSTRATYHFSATELRPATTVYIHHDGYPEYAFKYFLNAQNRAAEKLASGFLEAFIGANAGAEITSSHEAHGDTDYRYTFKDGRLTVQKSTHEMQGGSPFERWVTVYDGTVTDFIGEYRRIQGGAQ